METFPLKKNQLIEFINLFEQHTKTLNEPLISFYGHGCYTKNEALDFINNSDVLPEGFIIAAYPRKNDSEVSSVGIKLDEDSLFHLEAEAMSAVCDRKACSVPEAFEHAITMFLEYSLILDEID